MSSATIAFDDAAGPVAGARRAPRAAAAFPAAGEAVAALASKAKVKKAPAPNPAAAKAAPTKAPPPATIEPQPTAWSTDATDRAFYVARRNGQLAAAASLWIGIGGLVGTAAAMGAMPLNPAAAAGSAIAVGAGLYGFLTVVLSLLMNHSLERKVNEIRRTARIGCERMRIDDAPLMRSAIRDVLSEWMHINFFVRHLREASLVARWGFVAQGALTIAAVLALAPLAPAGFWAGVAWIAAPIVLSAVHMAYHLRLLRRQLRAAAIREDDPTEVLANRMVSLLDEVKALRKPLARG